MRINIGWHGQETVIVSGDDIVFPCLPKKLLPAYPVQAIANILDTATQELTLLRTQRTAID